MFDSHFRTLFLSNPAHLRLQSKRLIIERKDLLREKAPSFAEGLGVGHCEREKQSNQMTKIYPSLRARVKLERGTSPQPRMW